MKQPQYGSKPIRTEQTGDRVRIILDEKIIPIPTTPTFHGTQFGIPTHLIEEILSLSEPAQVKLNKIANLIRPC